MEKAVANRQIITISDLLQKSQGTISQVIPKHLTPERLIKVAMTTVRKTPKLLECEPMGLVAEIVQAAQFGLEPDNILGQAYLVPFYNNKTRRQECQLIIGYKGLISLARRSGEVSMIYARVIFEKEPFQLEGGIDAELKHTPKPPSERGDKIIGVYAVAKFKDGFNAYEFLWTEEVMKIAKASQAFKSSFSPWHQYPEEMFKKTAIRRLAKFLPLSPEFQQAAVLDEQQPDYKDLSEIKTSASMLTEVLTERLAEDTAIETTAEETGGNGDAIPTISKEKTETKEEPENPAKTAFMKLNDDQKYDVKQMCNVTQFRWKSMPGHKQKEILSAIEHVTAPKEEGPPPLEDNDKPANAEQDEF